MKYSVNNNSDYRCRVCENTCLTESYYPEIHFNNKVFKYYKCKNCKSINVFPSPDKNDLKKVYGKYDHTYLEEIPDKIEYNFDFPFANYQGYQIAFLNRIKSDLKNKTLLDYACGNGFYLKYAENLGAKVTGIEFDEDFVKLLQEKTDFKIYTFEKALEIYKNKPFDFIHLGHVLEHLVNPNKAIEKLKLFADNNTTFIIDGPLESNNCLSRFYIDFGSRIKSKKYNEFAPQHLTITNNKSQLLFFKKVGFKQEAYIVDEQYFPLPYKLHKSIGLLISYIIATISILISKTLPTSGNIFHYRGKIES